MMPRERVCIGARAARADPDDHLRQVLYAVQEFVVDRFGYFVAPTDTERILDPEPDARCEPFPNG
jgi:hypothetical protein